MTENNVPAERGAVGKLSIVCSILLLIFGGLYYPISAFSLILAVVGGTGLLYTVTTYTEYKEEYNQFVFRKKIVPSSHLAIYAVLGLYFIVSGLVFPPRLGGGLAWGIAQSFIGVTLLIFTITGMRFSKQMEQTD